jgi:hypothetical protein
LRRVSALRRLDRATGRNAPSGVLFLDKGSTEQKGALAMPKLKRWSPLAFVLPLVACALSAVPARAMDETEALLVRARQRRLPTARDSALASEMLADWVDEKPEDATVRRAFERIARGRRPASEQLPALVRLHAAYSRSHAEAVAREQARPRGGQVRPGGGTSVAARPRRWRRRDLAAIGVIGALVLAGGVVWILVTHWRRGGRGGRL